MNIERLFKRYGRTVFISDKNGNILDQDKCFVQPLRYKNKMYLEGTPTEIGMNESGYYLFLAPPSFDIDRVGNNGYLSDGIQSYHIDRFEKFYFGEKVHFIWAILRLCFPDTYPSYNHFV